MSRTMIDKVEAGQILNDARVAKGLAWRDVADHIDKPLVWTVAALLGKHPVPAECAEAVSALLGLDDDVVSALKRQPYRVADADLRTDPTVYRFHEALDVYGQALKELIHERIRRRHYERDQLLHELRETRRSTGRSDSCHLQWKVPALPMVT